MENKIIEFQLPLKKNNNITNIIYNISIELVSKIIVFSLESKEIPKMIVHKGYSYSDIINIYNYFSNKEYFPDIESIYEQLQIYIENSIDTGNSTPTKKAEQKSSIELIEEETNQIKLVIPTLVSFARFIEFVFLNKIDTDSTIIELSDLYKKLKSDKDREIDDLNKKINENEKKYDALQKEVALLKKEIINLQDTQANKIKILENNFNEKIKEINDEKEKICLTYKNNLDDLEKEINENYDLLNEKIKEIQSDMRIQSLYFAFNVNSQNFKTILQNYYKLLKEVNPSFLSFYDEFKKSYDIIIDLIINSIKGKNGTNVDKIIESSETTNYKKYDQTNWNWFLISNVIHQMFYSNNDDIELNEKGVSQTLEKIYILQPDFKNNFELELEEAKWDIRRYVDRCNLGDIIKAIKIYIF